MNNKINCNLCDKMQSNLCVGADDPTVYADSVTDNVLTDSWMSAHYPIGIHTQITIYQPERNGTQNDL